MSSYVNPLADVDANDATGTVKKTTKILTESNKNTTLSRWFVSNQKTEEWPNIYRHSPKIVKIINNIRPEHTYKIY